MTAPPPFANQPINDAQHLRERFRCSCVFVLGTRHPLQPPLHQMLMLQSPCCVAVALLSLEHVEPFMRGSGRYLISIWALNVFGVYDHELVAIFTKLPALDNVSVI